MSTLEEIRQDALRDAYQDEVERHAPEPCGCQFLSECCGAAPHSASDVAADNRAGICGQCRDHAGFEPSDEMTWKLKDTVTYGDDADGRRGVPLRLYECRVCGDEREVIG